MNKDLMKNITRYINYFELIRSHPLLDYKQFYVSSIVINGAPAISNPKNNKETKYISIDNDSFYCPVVRILCEGKLVYSSFSKEKRIDQINYSAVSSVKFEVNQRLFNDTVIELLHFEGEKFKQLFLIQFNTLFIDVDCPVSRFSRQQIDGISKDIRYPEEFYLDVFYDFSKTEDLSVYNEDVSTLKSVISEFVANSIQKKETKQQENTYSKPEIKKDSMLIEEKIQNNVISEASSIREHHHEEGDEDLDAYLKNLESKA